MYMDLQTKMTSQLSQYIPSVSLDKGTVGIVKYFKSPISA